MPQEPVNEESLQDSQPPASEANGSNGHAGLTNAGASTYVQQPLITPHGDDVENCCDSPKESSCKQHLDVPGVNVRPVVVDIHITDSWDCLTVM